MRPLAEVKNFFGVLVLAEQLHAHGGAEHLAVNFLCELETPGRSAAASVSPGNGIQVEISRLNLQLSLQENLSTAGDVNTAPPL